MELLRKWSHDVATYFEVTDPNRRSSTVTTAADIRALMVDLKESQVHTFVPGRKVVQTGSKKGKGVVDIFMEGKEVLEHSAFRNWKDRTGKFGADVFGCDAEYRHQQGAVVGDMDGGEEVPGDKEGVPDDEEGVPGNEEEMPGDEEEVMVEFDAEADLERENEI